MENKMFKYLLSLLYILLIGCSTCYLDNYLSFTNYDPDDYTELKTPYGITVYTNEYIDLFDIDNLTIELEECLGIKVKKKCFSVLIPDDWFYSSVSNQQLLPYAAPIEYCWAKGLDIPEECDGVAIPTTECPITCNWRAATQNNCMIITVPNLVLYKAELARLITGVNNPWLDENIQECL